VPLGLALRATGEGRAQPSTMVTIPQSAKNMSATPGTSEMYLGDSTAVSLGDLLKGLMVSSGNDAAIAIADFLAGDQAAFVALMNQEARKLGMDHTHFVNPHGLPASDEYSTAADMAVLAAHIMETYPDYPQYTALPSYTFAGITTDNYNGLIGKDPAVNGMKSGYISSAHLVATATQNGTQIVAVVMGVTAPTEAQALQQAATDDAELLQWAFNNFHEVSMSWSRQLPAAVRVWEGRSTRVAVKTSAPSWLTLPGSSGPQPVVRVVVPHPVVAPVGVGQTLGSVLVSEGGKAVASYPLQAAGAVRRGSVLHVLWDRLRLAVDRWLGHTPKPFATA